MPYISFTSTSKTWTNFNTGASVAVGTKVTIQNIGSGAIYIQTSPTTPSATAGYVLNEHEFYTVKAGSETVWLLTPDSDNINVYYTLGDNGNYLDERVYTGLKALTVQPFVEANVKNSTQWEFSSLNPSLGAGLFQDSVFIVGSQPVIIKSRQITFTGSGITAQVFETPTYTGGTTASIYNLNRVLPNAPLSSIVTGVTTTVTGVQISAPTYAFGADTSAPKTVGTFATAGIERVLKPNTAYLLRITNNDASACKIAVYTTFYEGELSSQN